METGESGEFCLLPYKRLHVLFLEFTCFISKRKITVIKAHTLSSSRLTEQVVNNSKWPPNSDPPS